MAVNKTEEFVHAQKILNQSAVDIQTVWGPQQEVIMMEYSPGLFFKRIWDGSKKKDEMKDVILLDKQTTDYFCN